MKEINVQDHPEPLKLQQKTGGKKFDVGYKQVCWRQENEVTKGYFFAFILIILVLEVTFLHFP